MATTTKSFKSSDDFRTEQDQLAYALGAHVVGFIRDMGIETWDNYLFMQGVKDQFINKESTPLSFEDAGKFLGEYIQVNKIVIPPPAH